MTIIIKRLDPRCTNAVSFLEYFNKWKWYHSIQIFTSSEVLLLLKLYFDGTQIIFFLHILDPLGGLTLGIYHKRPPPGIGHYHPIVH